MLPIAGWAQQEVAVDTLKAAQAFQKGDSLRSVALYDSSSTYFQKAANLYADAGAWKRQFDALYKLSVNYSDQDHLEKASQTIDRALSLCQKHDLKDSSCAIRGMLQKGIIAETRADYKRALHWYEKGLEQAEAPKLIRQKIRLIAGIGDVYESQGKYSASIDKLLHANELYQRNFVGDKKLLSRLYNSLGIGYWQNGDGDVALKYYEQSLEIDKEILPAEHPGLAKDYNNIAIVYYYQSDYKRALDYMKNAVNVLRKYYGEDHKLVATGYSNVGVVYSEMGDMKQATNYMKKALAIREKILGKNHPDIAIGYQNLGAIYYDMKAYDKAISYYKRSEAIHLKNFPNGHPELANVYANLGEAYAGKGNYEKALEYYQKDLNTNFKFLPEDHPFIGDTYNKIGEAYLKLKNYPMALNYLDDALPIFVKDFSDEKNIQDLSLGNIVYPEKLLKTMELKGEALHESSIQNRKPARLEQSLQTYLQAVQLVERLQYSLTREGSKFVLRQRTHVLYQKGLETAFDLARQTGKSKYTEYAFYFAEKSKSQILLEQLQEANAEHFSGIPDSLIRQGRSLQTRLTNVQQKLFGLGEMTEEKDSQKRFALQDSLFDLHRSLEAHIHHLETDYPKYYKLKYKQVTIPSWKVQRHILSEGQTMIEYFFGEDSLFAFVMTPKTFAMRKLASDSLLRAQLTNYQQAIQEIENPNSFAHDSYRLYQKIVAPLADLVIGKQLLIVPDGPLSLLPFESLVSRPPADESSRFNELPYMIEEYTISYAPSAAYLDVSNGSNNSLPKKQFLGFAPVFDNMTASNQRELYPGVDRPLSALPLSKGEVEELRHFFNRPDGFWSFLKPDKKEADIFKEEGATEAAFKALPLKDYRFIHLATHAFVSEDHPGESGIVFATSGDGTEDGILHVSEIYNLRLSAQLVTLSACKTGIGKMAEGEGVMSISRAFQYAGAKDLLVSLWNVNDRSTAELMVDFYKKNEDEKDMRAALRKAKTEMIKQGRYAEPKYWAPFIFIGH